jgi:cellulose synthase/poly-beta-1,6-N-acetylglucosamine synthase-like glycosyltransferase
LLWIFITSLFYNQLIQPITEAPSLLITILTSFNLIFILYFWLNGLKDVIYTIYYFIFYKDNKPVFNRRSYSPLVELVYCTCNDFNPQALLLSMQQQYVNFRTIILDDSNDQYYKDLVNKFARQYGIEVIRRENRIGFKAGNLNNFLQSRRSLGQYFVLLDSDEIIPTNFISRCLDYFAQSENIAVVQANHITYNERNSFMDTYARGVVSHWSTYQSIKDKYGFLSLLGHGAMIKKDAYRRVNGFPELVAEDLCFSIELRKLGLFVKFAPDIICQEEYPISYQAFKKRHSKWTQGNMEFIQKYTTKIFKANMAWFEKLDIFLFTYALPLTFIFSLYLVNNLIILPLLNYDPKYNLLMLIPTFTFLLSPMLNDIIYYIWRLNPIRLINYLIHTILLYGSMFYISLESSFKSLFNKAVFIVTPKKEKEINLLNAFTYNYKEIIFGFFLLIVAYILQNNILGVVLIALPSIISPYLTMKSNKPVKIKVK